MFFRRFVLWKGGSTIRGGSFVVSVAKKCRVENDMSIRLNVEKGDGH